MCCLLSTYVSLTARNMSCWTNPLLHVFATNSRGSQLAYWMISRLMKLLTANFKELPSNFTPNIFANWLMVGLFLIELSGYKADYDASGICTASHICQYLIHLIRQILIGVTISNLIDILKHSKMKINRISNVLLCNKIL